MRCPDCNKFVSLETQEPEMNGMDCDYDPASESFTVSCDGRTVRNCADCGTELKALDWDMDQCVDLDQFEGFGALSPEQVQTVKKALEDGTAEYSAEDTSTEYDESGGHRYKKNMITSRVNFEIEIKVPGLPNALTFAGVMESSNAASEFEEQC